MLTSHSPDPLRTARRYVLNGHAIPATVAAQLEARGIDVGELEQRLRNNNAWRV
jgi:hypothetical protein